MSVKCKKVDSKFVYLLSLKILSYLRLISGVLMVNYHSNLFYNKKRKEAKYKQILPQKMDITRFLN